MGIVLDRGTKLSDDAVKSLPASERSASEALEQLVIAIALSEEVLGTHKIAKEITALGDRWPTDWSTSNINFCAMSCTATPSPLSSRDGSEAQADRSFRPRSSRRNGEQSEQLNVDDEAMSTPPPSIPFADGWLSRVQDATEIDLASSGVGAAKVEIARLRALLRTAFSHAPIGLAVVDRSGRVVIANPSLCTIVGVRVEALVGRPITDLVDRSSTARSRWTRGGYWPAS